MEKQISIISFLFLFISYLTITPASAKIFMVNKEGGWDFTSIQEAIDVAQTGDVIKVSSGIYNENIIINKDIKLIGAVLTGNIQNPLERQIGYIVNDDYLTANRYKQFLALKQYSVTLINYNNIPSTNLYSFGLLIIGPEIKFSLPGEIPCPELEAISAYKGPILGLGLGGYSLFKGLGLTIGQADTIKERGKGITPLSLHHKIWKTPNYIPIDVQDPFIIPYKEECTYHSINVLSLPAGVEAIGTQADKSDLYPIILENKQYCFWGFEGLPMIMTKVGRDLFENVVECLVLSVMLPKETEISGNGRGHVVTFNNVTSAKIDSFRITNSGPGYTGIYISVSTLTICNNCITNNKDGIQVIDSAVHIQNNIINKNGYPDDRIDDYGILWVHSEGFIYNNLIINTIGSGIKVFSHESRSLSVINNTITSNSLAGIDCDYCSPIIKNNIIVDNEFGICAVNHALPIISYNDVWDNSYNYNQDSGGQASAGPGDISRDPLYVNPDKGDYHLKDTSPCKDAGDPDPVYNDLDGTQNDMGAYGGFLSLGAIMQAPVQILDITKINTIDLLQLLSQPLDPELKPIYVLKLSETVPSSELLEYPSLSFDFIPRDENNFQIESQLSSISIITQIEDDSLSHNLLLIGDRGIIDGEKGQAGLPCFTEVVAIPIGAEMEVELLEGIPKIMSNVMLFPIQPESNGQDDPFPLVIDESYYNQNKILPENLLSIRYHTFFGGKIAYIKVTTARYNPALQELYLYPHMLLRVSFIGGEGNYFPDGRRSSFAEELSKTFLENYSMIEPYDPQLGELGVDVEEAPEKEGVDISQDALWHSILEKTVPSEAFIIDNVIPEIDMDEEDVVYYSSSTSEKNTMCLKQAACDKDGDGFAYKDCYKEYREVYDPNNPDHQVLASQSQCTKDPNGDYNYCYDPEGVVFVDTKMCPEIYVQSHQVECVECDHVEYETTYDGSTNTTTKNIKNLNDIKKHIREYAIEHGIIPFSSSTIISLDGQIYKTFSASGWEGKLDEIHPGQMEKADNYIDDDCDGIIDETEYDYYCYGKDNKEGGFKIIVKIKDPFVKEYAHTIIARVFPLEKIIDEDHLTQLKLGLGKGYQPTLPDRYEKELRFDYDGSPAIILDIDGLPNESRVWAVELNYFYSMSEFIGILQNQGYHVHYPDPFPPMTNGKYSTSDPVSTTGDPKILFPDRDEDGDIITNGVDNCPYVPNPYQEDQDEDAVGDICDNCPPMVDWDKCSDLDIGDPPPCSPGSVNIPYCLYCYPEATQNPDQDDSDGDGVGDVCDLCDTISTIDDVNEFGCQPCMDSDGGIRIFEFGTVVEYQQGEFMAGVVDYCDGNTLYEQYCQKGTPEEWIYNCESLNMECLNGECYNFLPLLCIDEDGHPIEESYCLPDDPSCSYRNRIASEVYLTATAEYINSNPVDMGLIRRRIVNRALYEWSLSLAGDVGYQTNYGFTAYSYPNGTKYTADAEYDCWWCSEFVAYVYNKAESSFMTGDDWTNTDKMFDWFDEYGTMYIDDEARDRISGTCTSCTYAKHGDYLLIGGEEEEKKGDHSAIFLAFNSESPDDCIWKIGGNEGKRIQTRGLEFEDRYRGLGVPPDVQVDYPYPMFLGETCEQISQGKVGTTLDIPIKLESAFKSIRLFEFDILFDPTVFQYSGYTPGNLVSLFDTFVVTSIDEGVLHIKGETKIGNIPAGAYGSLVDLQFVIKGGQAYTQYYIQLTNLSGDIASFAPIEGEFFIQSDDSIPPVLTCPPDITVSATGLSTIVTFSATAMDNEDPDPDIELNPPSGFEFPIGITEVTATATDASGNKNHCTFTVTVVDACLFNTKINARGIYLEGNSYYSEVVIGIEERDKTTILSSSSQAYTVRMMIKDLQSDTLYYEDRREEGNESEKWLIRVEVPSDIIKAFPDTHYPLLSWNSNEFCSMGTFRLCSSNEKGEILSLLVDDMTKSENYQIKEDDTEYFCLVWSHDITVEMELEPGWSMISLSVTPYNTTVFSLFPEAKVVYGYEKGRGYVRIKEGENMEAGKGYWILLNEAKIYSITGRVIDDYNLTVQDGRYMIGGCTYPAQASVEGGNIRVIYDYIPGLGYQRVIEAESLDPGKGYWILFNNIMDQAELMVTTKGF